MFLMFPPRNSRLAFLCHDVCNFPAPLLDYIELFPEKSPLELQLIYACSRGAYSRLWINFA